MHRAVLRGPVAGERSRAARPARARRPTRIAAPASSAPGGIASRHRSSRAAAPLTSPSDGAPSLGRRTGAPTTLCASVSVLGARASDASDGPGARAGARDPAVRTDDIGQTPINVFQSW